MPPLTSEIISELSKKQLDLLFEEYGKNHLTRKKILEAMSKKIEGAGKDTEITTNLQGGSQSKIPYRFDLLDGPALAAAAKVLQEGAEKYGENNWRLIPVHDHLNHLLMHTFAYLSGDTQDDHLSHILCRAIFALGVNIDQTPQK